METLEKIIDQNSMTMPDEMIYEVLDGNPVYYAGYKEVLYKQKTIDDIMGSSGLQSEIIDFIVEFFHKIKFEGNRKYKILYSELGLHLALNNNLAADIAIYNKSDIVSNDLTDKYMVKPPRVIFEVDTKADVSNFSDALEYLELKSKKLLDFGVEKLFWILTQSKKIIVITENKKWYFADWDEEINVVDDIKFTLQTLIENDGLITLSK